MSAEETEATGHVPTTRTLLGTFHQTRHDTCPGTQYSRLSIGRVRSGVWPAYDPSERETTPCLPASATMILARDETNYIYSIHLKAKACTWRRVEGNLMAVDEKK